MNAPDLLGPTPLIAVEAVAIDLETTGLDTRIARIVQFGAATIRAGRLDSEAQIEGLVAPGVPIPPSATAIHGIADADVAGAPNPAEALAQLGAFLAGRPVIGHAVLFDLAVLAAEASRHGVERLQARFLDTRILGEIAAPALPDYNLETLCAFLGIAPEARHTALGDARTAARIFCGLIPYLRALGVRSWAEAEAASRRVTDMSPPAGPGLDIPRPPAGEPPGALLRIDSYPYRHRARDVMNAPPQVLPAERSLQDAVRVMAESRISSVFVDGDGPTGILTERDVLRAVAAHGGEALATPIGALASRPLQVVPADDLLYRAIGRMARLKVRHLGVAGEGGELVGALSARDLLRVRASEALQLGDALAVAEDAPALAAAWTPLPLVAEALLAENVAPAEVSAVISQELAAATKRAAELAQAACAAEGLSLPGPYAVLVLGSAGRGESLLALDQDNALVFEAGEPDGPEDRYFARLGEIMADTLDAMGVPYCIGGVMAKNPRWRGSVATWRDRAAGWVRRSDPQDLLAVDIFFDARTVAGDLAVAQTVLDAAHGQAQRAPEFIKLLAAAGPEPPNAVGLFGRIRTEAGRIDLKLMALLPIVEAARVLALRHGIRANGTTERLQAVRALGIGLEADLDNAIAAHRIVVAAILRQQIRDIHAGVAPSNKVELAALSRHQRDDLRDALRVVPTLIDVVHAALF
jgi:CBS domain-containing protein